MASVGRKILHSGRRFVRYGSFLKDYRIFKQLAGDSSRFPVHWQNRSPRLGEKTGATDFDRHYIYHTAWAARTLKKINPDYHVDISSTLYFCAIASAFVPIRYYEYRPPDLSLPNLDVAHADLLHLPFADHTVASLSCLHVIEHVGLGRYGDLLDPEGDMKAIRELQRVVAPGGSLLVVVPVGRPMLHFNAHRVYRYDQFRTYFKQMKLKEFVFISERGGPLMVNAAPQATEQEAYGCGCFWFTKL